MAQPVIALLHPGAMGASVGNAARAQGSEVRWCAGGRSSATATRAGQAQLRECVDLPQTLAGADWVLSVCPPEAAASLADQVFAQGFRGLYIDANAVAPATARGIADAAQRAGAGYVDGGIIGAPAWRSGTTRLYLSGARAAEVASAFAGSALEAIVIGDQVSAASALKMCYAAWTKGTNALLLNIRALARAEDVETALLSEWAASQPELRKRSESAAAGSAPKAWRWVGEMKEIASSFSAAGLMPEFHTGASEVYARMAEFKDRSAELDEVLAALLRRNG